MVRGLYVACMTTTEKTAKYIAELNVTARHSIPVEVAYADGKVWTRSLISPGDWRATDQTKLTKYEEI